MDRKEIKKAFNEIEQKSQYLTQYQREFVSSLKRYFNSKKTLSSRQMECLLSIGMNTSTA